MLEVRVPSSTSGSSSGDHLLLLPPGAEDLGGQPGLLEWGSLSQGCIVGGADFSRRERVTPAPGTHPRTFPTAPPSPISLHFEQQLNKESDV